MRGSLFITALLSTTLQAQLLPDEEWLCTSESAGVIDSELRIEKNTNTMTWIFNPSKGKKPIYMESGTTMSFAEYQCTVNRTHYVCIRNSLSALAVADFFQLNFETRQFSSGSFHSDYMTTQFGRCSKL